MEGREERGAALVEYALLLALIAAVVVVSLNFLGNATSRNFSSTGSHLGGGQAIPAGGGGGGGGGGGQEGNQQGGQGGP
jgi:Flp pilus assembly pilin Flp